LLTDIEIITSIFADSVATNLWGGNDVSTGNSPEIGGVFIAWSWF
jgi:hypothetical protein